MDLFFVDISKDQKIYWQRLISDIREVKSFNPYVKSEDYYEIFKQIIISIILGERIVLLDNDLSDAEVKYLIGDTDFAKQVKSIEADKLNFLKGKKDFIEQLRTPNLEWRITLFTSGTTGLPKKIDHDFSSISRGVKISENHAFDTWGLAYNPTHMAGIQVFLQSVLNGNTVVRIFGYTPNQIVSTINDYKITNISATPTFYRLLLNVNFIAVTVKRITCGGERFDNNLTNKILERFPNAKIVNIYASTETGSLFNSSSDVFTVKSENKHEVKIENNELFVHQRLLGRGVNTHNSWFKTNDLVEIISKDPLSFRFIARTKEILNIGGYNVVPSEVENLILSFQGVINAVVYSKKNSVMGNVLCSDVMVSDNNLTEEKIRILLKGILQEYKIPRIIRICENLEISRTGKIIRNKL
jgi:acyl-coenzyme A synthetase/AMP-(fatty) acid ligase